MGRQGRWRSGRVGDGDGALHQCTGRVGDGANGAVFLQPGRSFKGFEARADAISWQVEMHWVHLGRHSDTADVITFYTSHMGCKWTKWKRDSNYIIFRYLWNRGLLQFFKSFNCQNKKEIIIIIIIITIENCMQSVHISICNTIASYIHSYAHNVVHVHHHQHHHHHHRQHHHQHHQHHHHYKQGSKEGQSLGQKFLTSQAKFLDSNKLL